jgi:hypothetical protein
MLISRPGDPPDTPFCLSGASEAKGWWVHGPPSNEQIDLSQRSAAFVKEQLIDPLIDGGNDSEDSRR